MKWIKSSERTPLNNNLVHVQFSTGKTDFKTTAFFENLNWFRQDGSMLISFGIIEWLDESEPSFTLDEMHQCFLDAFMKGIENGEPFPALEKYFKTKYDINIK